MGRIIPNIKNTSKKLRFYYSLYRFQNFAAPTILFSNVTYYRLHVDRNITAFWSQIRVDIKLS